MCGVCASVLYSVVNVWCMSKCVVYVSEWYICECMVSVWCMCECVVYVRVCGVCASVCVCGVYV